MHETRVHDEAAVLDEPDMRTLAFIEHAQLPSIFNELNRRVRKRLFIPFVAADGAGKRRVLFHWACHKAGVDQTKVLWTNLVDTNQHGGKKVVASAIARVTFSRALFRLRMLTTPTRTWVEHLDQTHARTYDDDRFTTLRDTVVGKIRVQGIRTWIINDAHLLDQLTMHHVLTAWKECNQQFSVIFAAKQRHDQTLNEPLRDQFDWQTDYKHYTTRRLELTTVGEEEFKKEIFPDVLVDLEADANAEVQRNEKTLIANAWAFTGGHWDRIARMATEFDAVLGPATGELRKLTQPMVDQVWNELMPPALLDD